MGRLTEANYLSRKVKLRENIEAAKVAHRDAAFRHEIGEGDEAAVVEAKAAISALEDRVIGLDAAWSRARDDAAAEQRQLDAQSRAAVVAAVDKHLKARTEASRHLSKLAKEIGEAWQRFEAAGSGVIDAAHPYAPRLGAEGFRQLRELMFGDFYSARPSLGGEMLDAGLKMTSNDFPTTHARKLIDRGGGLVAYIDKRNGMAEAIVTRLLDSE